MKTYQNNKAAMCHGKYLLDTKEATFLRVGSCLEPILLVLQLMEEIPAPVDMVKIPLFTRFYTSQVVQDFFHQQ